MNYKTNIKFGIYWLLSSDHGVLETKGVTPLNMGTSRKGCMRK
jgi:hypothetical protein